MVALELDHLLSRSGSRPGDVAGQRQAAAAGLGARKRGAIDEPHAQTSARQTERRHAAGKGEDGERPDAREALGCRVRPLALEAEEPRSGGEVIVTLGNHEAEFLNRPKNKKATEFDDELAAKGLDPRSVATPENPYGRWLMNRPIAARVNSWFFAHAGNTAGATEDEIAKGFREAVDADTPARAATSASVGRVRGRTGATLVAAPGGRGHRSPPGSRLSTGRGAA